jgi:hypothetical protein
MPTPQEIFQRDLASDAFQAGCVRGRWGLLDDTSQPPGASAIAWPNAVIWIAAVPRPKSPERFYFYFDLNGYPAAAPTAYCWDPTARTVLPDQLWPRSRDPQELTFRQGWPGNGRRALYAPWDRASREGGGHAEWTALAGLIWNPEKHTIADYLRFTHELLNVDHYTGTYEAANP